MTVSSGESSVGFLLASAIQRAQSLRKELEVLSKREYAFPHPSTFLRVLQDLSENTIGDIESLRTSPTFMNPRSPLKEQIETIERNAEVVGWIHDLIGVVQEVDSPRLPHEIVRSLESLAQELLLAPQAGIILKATNNFTYMILDFGRPLDPTQPAGSSTPNVARFTDRLRARLDGLFVLYFPLIESDDILMHTLFLHELGHLVFPRRMRAAIRDDFDTRLKHALLSLRGEISTSIQAYLRNNAYPASSTLVALIREYQIVGSARAIALQWLEEIFCDLCALRIVGPAYLRAFTSQLLPFSPHEVASRTHPDIDFRLQLLTLFSRRMQSASKSYGSLLQEFGGESGMIPPLGGAHAYPVEIEVRIAKSILEPTSSNSLLEAMCRWVETNIESPVSSVEFLNKHACATSSIEELIPPLGDSSNTVSCSAAWSVALVLSSLWSFRLGGFPKWMSRYEWTDDKCVSVLDELGMKALESSELERRFVSLPRKRSQAPAQPSTS